MNNGPILPAAERMRRHRERRRSGMRAREAEQDGLRTAELTPDLQHFDNAKAANRRKRALSPREPKANPRYRRWKVKMLGRFGAASKVRRINPVTGEVMS